MKTLHLLTLALFLLGACALPPAPPKQSPPIPLAPAATSSSGATERVEPGDVPEISSASPKPTIPQRMLSGGLLEIGEASTPITLLLFTNHACGYCRAFHRDLLPRLMVDYVEAGQLRIVMAAFAIKKYADSDVNAATALCAARQGKGREMQDALFQMGGLGAARTRLPEMELDQKMLQECLKDPAVPAVLSVQKQMAESLGVTVVPTMFLNGKKLVGLPEYPDLRGNIEALLRPSR